MYFSNKIEAGCDEAGRGALAGPVVAASVILPKSFKCTEINDSKVLSYSILLQYRCFERVGGAKHCCDEKG